MGEKNPIQIIVLFGKNSVQITKFYSNFKLYDLKKISVW